MRIRRIMAIARKESLQVIRDPRSLMIALLLPLMQMFMLGYGVNLDVQHIPLCAFDQEGTQQSQDLLKRFANSRYFEMHKVVADIADATHQIDDGTCRLAVVIPIGFTRNLADKGGATVQVLIDGTDSNTANIAANYANAVVGGYSSDLELKAIQRRGGQVQTLTPIDVQARVWFNEDLESRYFIIPGVVALVMAIVGAQLTSLTISREWERGTMELLISTPVTPLELMVGKLFPYFAIGMVDAAICLVLAVEWFEVPFHGTLLTLFFTTSLFLTVVLCIGYSISAAIRSQVGAGGQAYIVVPQLEAGTRRPEDCLAHLGTPCRPLRSLSGDGDLQVLDCEDEVRIEFHCIPELLDRQIVPAVPIVSQAFVETCSGRLLPRCVVPGWCACACFNGQSEVRRRPHTSIVIGRAPGLLVGPGMRFLFGLAPGFRFRLEARRCLGLTAGRCCLGLAPGLRFRLEARRVLGLNAGRFCLGLAPGLRFRLKARRCLGLNAGRFLLGLAPGFRFRFRLAARRCLGLTPRVDLAGRLAQCRTDRGRQRGQHH